MSRALSASRWRHFAVAFFVCALAGCESVGYYAHLAGGQLKLLTDRTPVARMLQDLEARAESDPASARLKGRLELSQLVLTYADNTMGLPVGGRYRSYVALNREAVVWNLFAAPPLSLEPHLWCYPLLGCLPYRGYFDRSRAERQQARLLAKGLETHLGGVTAYSTLGWFDDPLLSTFVDLDDTEFVELLLHELAHSRVWVGGDATFNESFASFVGREGARSWFDSRGRRDEFEARMLEDAGYAAAMRILEETRTVLTRVYASGRDDGTRLAAKRAVLDAAGACLEDLAERTGNEGYRDLVARLNNAYLASLATYADAVPVFARLFETANGEWLRFFERVDALAALDAEQRALALSRSGENEIAADGDDHRADQIQCQALLRHGLDGEAPGAEHDHVRRGGDREHERA